MELLPGHRAVQVVGRFALAPARLEVGDVEVDRFGVDDGRDGVVEAQPLATHRRDVGGELIGGERAGGDDGEDVVVGQRGHDLVAQGDALVPGDGLLHLRGEHLAVHGERVARRHLGELGGAHDQRAQQPHLRLDEADRVVGRVRAEGVAAHQFGQPVADLRGGVPRRLHLEKLNVEAALGELPSRLAPSEAAADHTNTGSIQGAHRATVWPSFAHRNRRQRAMSCSRPPTRSTRPRSSQSSACCCTSPGGLPRAAASSSTVRGPARSASSSAGSRSAPPRAD